MLTEPLSLVDAGLTRLRLTELFIFVRLTPACFLLGVIRRLTCSLPHRLFLLLLTLELTFFFLTQLLILTLQLLHLPALTGLLVCLALALTVNLFAKHFLTNRGVRAA